LTKPKKLLIVLICALIVLIIYLIVISSYIEKKPIEETNEPQPGPKPGPGPDKSEILGTIYCKYFKAANSGIRMVKVNNII